MTPKEAYYEKRAQLLLRNLRARHFDAYYCADKASALHKALELIPQDALVGWGGAASAQEIGLMDALRQRNDRLIDRDLCTTLEEREAAMRACFQADVFLTGANAISMDGEMVNIDGNGNRVGAIVYGPDSVIVVAGMNKVAEDLDAAIVRARTVAAPTNQQRFLHPDNPCTGTGICADCKSVNCICNQILITRHCRPAGRIKFILVGEELGY